MLVIIFEELCDGHKSSHILHAGILEFHCSVDWRKQATAMAVVANERWYAFVVMNLPPGIYEYKWKMYNPKYLPDTLRWQNDCSGRPLVGPYNNQKLVLNTSFDYCVCMLSSMNCWLSCRKFRGLEQGIYAIDIKQNHDISGTAADYFRSMKEPICLACAGSVSPWCYTHHLEYINYITNLRCFWKFVDLCKRQTVLGSITHLLLRDKLPDVILGKISKYF